MANWIASLSDGRRLTESELTVGRDSAWTTLKRILEKENVYITQIQLVVNSRRYNSPSLGKKNKSLDQVRDLFACRKIRMRMAGSAQAGKEYISYSYRLGNFRHFTWVDQSTNETYSEITPIDLNWEKDIGYG